MDTLIQDLQGDPVLKKKKNKQKIKLVQKLHFYKIILYLK